MIPAIEELTYRITTHFGEIDNFHPQPHTGIDYATPLSSVAQSLSDGIVGKISNDHILGENIRVTASGGKEWVYGHLSQVDVTYGQHIKLGDTLGLTGGQPGDWGAGHSSGPHIHISLLQSGQVIDPTPSIKALSDPSLWDKLTAVPHVSTPSEMFMNYVNSISQSIWHAIVPAVVPLSHVIALVGGGILIVLFIAGYKPGLNKLGILVVSNLLVNIVFQ
jgi:hypothetical protein